MNFNYDVLKKIPVFKNVDFEDPRSRRRVALTFAAAALVLVLLIADAAAPSRSKGSDGGADTALLEVPQGQDMDELLAVDDMLAAHGRRTPGNKDIFQASSRVDDNDPLSFIRGDSLEVTPEAAAMAVPEEQPEREAVTMEDIASSRESRKRRAMEVFGLLDDAERTTPETVRGDGAPSRKDAAARAFGLGEEPEPKPAPRTGSASKSVAAVQKKVPQAERPAQETAAEEPQPDPVRLRRSGGVQSLDGDFYSIEGISSLDSEPQYLEDDPDHPYKVIFTRSQKIKSGDRISLRLLEDMPAGTIMLPKNTHVYGTCSISDRLYITVNSIEINGKFYTLGLSAFDSDGGEGIYCPETSGQQAADQAKSQLGSTAQSALSTAASLAGSAIGSPYIGSAAGGLVSTGARMIMGRGGSTAVEITSGYVFYLLKNQ